MWLKVTNLYCVVTKADPVEEQFLYDYLSFQEPNARFTSAFKARRWDGRTRMFNRVLRRFPAGLLSLVRRGAARAGHAVQVQDARAPILPIQADTSWLDPVREQPQALAAALAGVRGIIQAPTGAGKTEVFSAICKSLACPCLILVNTKDLLHQTAERLTKRTGEFIGLAGDGQWNPQRITVATFQTLHRALRTGPVKELLASIGCLISDEAHILPAGTFMEVFNAVPNAYYRLGFSATPLARGDQRNVLLVAATGEVLYRVSAQSLIAAGVLSEPTIRMVPVHQVVAGDDWQEVYRNGVSTSAKRNAIVASAVVKAAKPALVFVKEIDHGRQLLAAIRAKGLTADFVSGVDSTASRKGATKRLQRGDIDVLVCSVIFNQGIDIPEVRSVVNAAGGKSDIQTQQKLGRGMRVTDDKHEMELWDFDDQGNPWLEGHSDARRSAYLRAGYRVLAVSSSQ